jgi:hypothetical protein
VINFKRTLFCFIIPRAVFLLVSACYHVAWIAVMGVSVAEPKCNGAAEFAFKVDVVGAVLITVFHAGPHRLCRALCAHKLLWLKFLKHILGVTAVNHAAKIRGLTLVALVVSQFEQRKLTQFVVV